MNEGSSCVVEREDLSEPAMRYLEKLFRNHEQRIKSHFETEINSLKIALAQKDKALEDLQSNVTRLESDVSVIRAANEHLIIEHDNLAQYGRRMNVRIEGIEYNAKETNDDLQSKLSKSLKSIGVEVKPDTYHRFHRSGRPYSKNGRTYCQTIVRFRHWKPRLQAQKGKKIARDEKLPIQIRNDLTARRYQLFKKATDQLPKRKDVFAFADANSNLVVRDGSSIHYFNTEAELADIIANIQ